MKIVLGDSLFLQVPRFHPLDPGVVPELHDLLRREWASVRCRLFLDHYHRERNHQGLANRLIAPWQEVGRMTGSVACRERLGGLLRYYYREAA